MAHLSRRTSGRATGARQPGESGRVCRVLGGVLAVLLCGGFSAEAHRLDLSLRVAGHAIHGTASLHGGRPAAGAMVEVRLAGGELLAKAVTDGEGRFIVPVDRQAAMEVVVYTRDGHAARARLAAEALPSGLGEAASAAAQQTQEELARRVAHLVAGEVSRQIVPLSDGLADLERRIAVRDVLGGLGYLLGLAGLAAYLLGRRRPDREGTARP